MSELISSLERYFIRRMKEDDLPAVRAIEGLSFSNPWSDNTFRGEIQNTPVSSPLVVVRRPGEEVVGYIVYWQIRDDVQVNNIAVHPEFRRLGIGEQALRQVIEEIRFRGGKLITLEVRPSNTGALHLYKKLGFKMISVRKGYYSYPPEDAFVLALRLD